MSRLQLQQLSLEIEALSKLHISFWIKEIIEEVLVWSEVAKGGTLRQRMIWREQGVHLMVHNIGLKTD